MAKYSPGFVPIMTSNTAPSPYVASSSTNVSGYLAYQAFDGLPSTGWQPSANVQTTPGNIKIDLGTGIAKRVDKYTVQTWTNAAYSIKTWTFEGSNDNTAWTILHSVTGAPAWTASETREYPITNSTEYRYYRINVTDGYNITPIIASIQLHQRITDNRSFIKDASNKLFTLRKTEFLITTVPVMTSNTAPSGIVTCSSISSTIYDGWNAFNGVKSSTGSTAGTGWLSGTWSGNEWLAYEFPTAKRIGKYALNAYTYATLAGNMPKDWTLQGSNDGITWDMLDTQTNITSWAAGETKTFYLTSFKAYTKFKLNITAQQTGKTSIALCEMELFDIDYIEIQDTGLTSPTQTEYETLGIDDLTLLTPPVMRFIWKSPSGTTLSDDYTYPTKPLTLFNSPKLITWTEELVNPLKLSYTKPEVEVVYVVSMNGSTWYSRVVGSWKIVTDAYREGMTKAQIEAIALEQWAEIYSEGMVYIKAVLKTDNKAVTPYVDTVYVGLPETFVPGNHYVVTDANSFSTLDWERVNNVSIAQTTPALTDARYAFSRDGKTTWEVFNHTSGVWEYILLNEIYTKGMTKTEVETVTTAEWDTMVWENSSDTLDAAVGLSTTSREVTPMVDQITFNYDTIVTPLECDSINIPVPDKGYRNTLINDVYVLKLAEGLGFDDSTTDYNFYTTPDRIKLRPLTVGTVIGGKESLIYEVEIINTYENYTFDVTLRASKAGAPALEFPTYCLLPDAALDEEKTVVEFSLTGDVNFAPQYPISFRLRPNERRLFYIRIKPTVTTAGLDTFQIVLSGRPV